MLGDGVRRRVGKARLGGLIVVLACSGCAFRLPGGPIVDGNHHRRRHVNPVTLLDNLGVANTTSRIAEDGRGGYSVAFDQSIGLLFHVERPTVITEVGGFVQSQASSTAPGRADVIVEIHPALADGRPNRDTVIASAAVSPQVDPHFVTFQRAALRTLLPPGDYYALFALAVQHPPATFDAVVLGSGSREVGPGQFEPYDAPLATGGVTHPPNYDPSVQQVREPLDIAELVRGVFVPRTRDDCRVGRWKDLGDEHGAALHDAADCAWVAEHR
jgi:hypothetical protein